MKKYQEAAASDCACAVLTLMLFLVLAGWLSYPRSVSCSPRAPAPDTGSPSTERARFRSCSDSPTCVVRIFEGVMPLHRPATCSAASPAEGPGCGLQCSRSCKLFDRLIGLIKFSISSLLDSAPT